MADIELLKRLAEAMQDSPSMETVRAWHDAARSSVVLALIAENEEMAQRLLMFELIHGDRASEIFEEVRALHAEVRRLKILAGEPVPPLPEEFVGPMPERPYERLRRKIKEQRNG